MDPNEFIKEKKTTSGESPAEKITEKSENILAIKEVSNIKQCNIASSTEELYKRVNTDNLCKILYTLTDNAIGSRQHNDEKRKPKLQDKE